MLRANAIYHGFNCRVDKFCDQHREEHAYQDCAFERGISKQHSYNYCDPEDNKFLPKCFGVCKSST